MTDQQTDKWASTGIEGFAFDKLAPPTTLADR